MLCQHCEELHKARGELLAEHFFVTAGMGLRNLGMRQTARFRREV